MKSSYDTDFYEWRQQQAEAVRHGAWEQIDREHLAEEIEDMWKGDSMRLWHHMRELRVWLLPIPMRQSSERPIPPGTCGSSTRTARLTPL